MNFSVLPRKEDENLSHINLRPRPCSQEQRHVPGNESSIKSPQNILIEDAKNVEDSSFFPKYHQSA